MSNNESRRYKHDIKRVGDLAERPVEMFKREYDDKTSLVLKSRNIPENEIFVNINGISSVNPIYINTNVIPFQMSIDLDLSKSKYHYIKLEDDLFVNDIINFENGIEYRFYVNQDEVGSHNITFGNDINGLFKEFGLNLEPNTTTLIKITPINNVLYILFDTNSREIPFNIKSFTPLNNSENININQNILTATFTKEIVFGVGDISIKRFSDDSIFQTFVVDNEVTDADLVINGNTLTINALDFEYDEQYYVTISNGSIVSFDGIPFAGISDKNTWTFKTAIPFVFTINTALGTGNSFNLPLRYRYNYDFTVDWGDDNTNTIKSFDDINKTHTYATGGEYQISITGLCEAWFFNNAGDRLKLTSIDQWGNTGFINMYGAFYGCNNLTTVNDTDGTWCSNITSMRHMFQNCTSLTTLDVSNWDVSNVTDMVFMFSNCSSLATLDVSNWDVSNVNDMELVFQNCSSLTTLDVSNWDVSNVIRMNGMFNSCSSLTTLDVSNWNVSNVTSMNSMFASCLLLTTLDVSNWVVSNVHYMSDIFKDVPLDTPSYDALLIGWSGLSSLKSNVQLDANSAKYSCAAEEAHNTLTSSPNNWSISDAGLNVNNCNVDLFKFTINTRKGTGNSFNLPLRSGYNYDFVVNWGDGNTSTVTSFDDINKTHTYATGGEYQVKISGLCEAWYFNNGGDRLKLTSIDQWGNTSFINMANAFHGCSNLTSVNDTDGTWCSNVTNMSSMFRDCSSLQTLDVSKWDVSKVTNMGLMFRGSSLITLDVSNWDVSKVTNMGNMFNMCTSLTTLDVSKWDVSNVTNTSSMFFICSSLTTLDVSKWNVSNVTSMYSMFSDTPLDTPSYDALLIGWSGLPSLKSNISFQADSAKYSSGAAATARQYIIDTYGWTIQDGGQVV